MKATAKHWVKYEGVWYRKGDVFDVPKQDAERMEEFCDIEQNEPDSTHDVAANGAGPEAEEAPKRRGRPRKTE